MLQECLIKVVDLFSGGGGLSLGFVNSGYEIVASYDKWKPAITVHNNNFGHPIFQQDLADVNAATEHVRNYEPDVIIGGPPCQSFSSAGKRDDDDVRGDLTISFANIVAAVKPKAFVMENVDMFAKKKQCRISRSVLHGAGYATHTRVLDASFCGVPQRRKRCFMVGVLGWDNLPLDEYYDQHLSAQPMTVRDYFGDKLDTEFYYRHPRSYARRAIFSIDEPSPTIRGVNRPIPKTYVFHPQDAVKDFSKVRVLTTEERSLIQTFPEGFSFKGVSKSDAEQVIGNAVPVNLAALVARSLKECLTIGVK